LLDASLHERSRFETGAIRSMARRHPDRRALRDHRVRRGAAIREMTAISSPSSTASRGRSTADAVRAARQTSLKRAIDRPAHTADATGSSACSGRMPRTTRSASPIRIAAGFHRPASFRSIPRWPGGVAALEIDRLLATALIVGEAFPWRHQPGRGPFLGRAEDTYRLARWRASVRGRSAIGARKKGHGRSRRGAGDPTPRAWTTISSASLGCMLHATVRSVARRRAGSR